MRGIGFRVFRQITSRYYSSRGLTVHELVHVRTYRVINGLPFGYVVDWYFGPND